MVKNMTALMVIVISAGTADAKLLIQSPEYRWQAHSQFTLKHASAVKRIFAHQFDNGSAGIVDNNTPTWTYHGWNAQYTGGSGSGTLLLPAGLGSELFTLNTQVDSWSWNMTGPVSSELTQPELGEYRTDGFGRDDVELDRLTGSWVLTGPSEQVSGSFDYQPVIQRPDRLWDDVAWQQARWRDGPLLDWVEFDRVNTVGPGLLWAGEVDGVPLRVELDRLDFSMSPTGKVPEPSSVVLMLVGLLTLIPERKRPWQLTQKTLK